MSTDGIPRTPGEDRSPLEGVLKPLEIHLADGDTVAGEEATAGEVERSAGVTVSGFELLSLIGDGGLEGSTDQQGPAPAGNFLT